MQLVINYTSGSTGTVTTDAATTSKIMATPYSPASGFDAWEQVATAEPGVATEFTVPNFGPFILMGLGADGELSPLYQLTGSSNTPTYSVQLTMDTTPNYAQENYTAYRLLVTASMPVGFDGAVFLYQRVPVKGDNANTQDWFVGVCKPVDIDEYPIEADVETTTLFYRRTTADLFMRYAAQVEEAQIEIEQQVNTLLRDLQRLQALKTSYSATVSW